MKKLTFPYLFSGFAPLDFPNCFTSLYMYLENITGDNDYICAVKEGRICDGCRNCSDDALHNKQERLFFLFDTVSGRAVTVPGWDSRDTDIYKEIYNNDSQIDFLFGFTGYSYEKHTTNLLNHIRASIDNGKPVLARMKDSGNNSFRIVVGYDGDGVMLAKDNKNCVPDDNIVYSGGEDWTSEIVVVTGKTERKYTLIDGLERMKHVFETDRTNNEWDKYIVHFGDYWNNLRHKDGLEIKHCFHAAAQGMHWKCHNIGEALCIYRPHDYPTPEGLPVFANWIWDELKALGDHHLFHRLGGACHDSHTWQWQMKALAETRDWSHRFYDELEWGMCEAAIMTLQKIKAEDDTIYHAICELIKIVEKV